MVQKRDSTLNKKLCAGSGHYSAQNRKLGDIGAYLDCLCLFLLDLSIRFQYHLLRCSVLYKLLQCCGIRVLKVIPRVQWVMSCISNTEMPLCRVVLKLAVILGCSAFGHNRALKRGCWSRTIISTPSKNDPRIKAFHPRVVSSGLVVWSVQTRKNILLFIKNIWKRAFYFWWHS